MMRLTKLPALVVLAGAALGGPALAVTPPAPLYVKAKNTHVKDSASPTANTLVVLQPGKEVTYQGREPGTPWCKVKVEDKKKTYEGLIYQANLAVSPPSLEVTSKNPGKPLSAEAFASSGAAVKALGPGALAYSKTVSRPESGRQLETLEKLAKDIPDEEVARYAVEGGLPEVVGTTALAKRSTKKVGSR